MLTQNLIPAIAISLVVPLALVRIYKYFSIEPTNANVCPNNLPIEPPFDIFVENEFGLTAAFDESRLTGTAPSVNGALFQNKAALFEYLEYNFGDVQLGKLFNITECNSDAPVRDPDIILKFIEKFHLNLLHVLDAHEKIFLCNKRRELVLIIDRNQCAKVENELRINLADCAFRSTSFVIQQKTILGYDLQYEKQSSSRFKNARNV